MPSSNHIFDLKSNTIVTSKYGLKTMIKKIFKNEFSAFLNKFSNIQ